MSDSANIVSVMFRKGKQGTIQTGAKRCRDDSTTNESKIKKVLVEERLTDNRRGKGTTESHGKREKRVGNA